MKPEKPLLLPLPELFSFSECLWFLDRGYDDCLHTIRDRAVIKAIEVNGSPLLFSMEQQDNHLSIQLLEGKDTSDNREYLKNYVKGWLDMNRRIEPFYALLGKDKRLSYMSESFRGLRLVGIPDLFEALCWSIIGQQINLSFAYKLKRRLVEAYGEKIEYKGANHYLFPGPQVLAEVSVTSLRAMQFSQNKAAYITGLAKSFVSGEMSRELLEDLPTAEEKRKALTALRGIGIWTANYTLMKSLREPASIPYGDSGLLQALLNHGIISERKETEKIHRFFHKYKDWESYLVFYLWRSLATI